MTEAAPLQKKKVIFRTYQIVWYILGVLETVLLFRFTFKLLGANAASPFVDSLYTFSDVFVLPFRGIFPVAAVERSVFEWAPLVAMAVYAAIAYGIVYLLQIVKPVEPEEVEQGVDNP